MSHKQFKFSFNTNMDSYIKYDMIIIGHYSTTHNELYYQYWSKMFIMSAAGPFMEILCGVILIKLLYINTEYINIDHMLEQGMILSINNKIIFMTILNSINLFAYKYGYKFESDGDHMLQCVKNFIYNISHNTPLQSMYIDRILWNGVMFGIICLILYNMYY